VGARQDDLISLQQLRALFVQIVVGERIPWLAPVIEKVRDVEIGAQALWGTGVPPDEVGPEVRDRPAH
jgi:hypothetical protein